MALKYRFVDYGRWVADSKLNSWPVWCLSLLAVVGGLVTGASQLHSAARMLKSLSASSSSSVSVPAAASASAASQPPGDFTSDLPLTVAVDDVITDIYKEAGVDALRVLSVASARQREGTVALAGKTAIQFKVTGSYLGLTHMLEHLLSTHPGMTVQKLSLGRSLGNAALGSQDAQGSSQGPSVDASVSLIQWSRPVR